MGNKIAVVCASDDKYAPYCGIMLTSVFENNRDRKISAYILTDKPFKAKNQKRFKRLSRRYDADINFVIVDNSFFKGFPIKDKHLSVVTYYRLYAPELLPKEIGKVLYLDCDVVVDRPIGRLFDMDWDSYAVGAAQDLSSGQPEIFEGLGYDISNGYFNAGVLFMNLDYWRTHDIGRKCIDYLASNYEHLHFYDQCVLNAVTWNCRKDLPVTYNYQVQLRDPWFFKSFKEEMKKDILGTESPHIIHYTGETKPWMTWYYPFPFNKTWHKYKKLSPWRFMMDLLPKDTPFKVFIKRYLLWPLGIMLHRPETV